MQESRRNHKPAMLFGLFVLLLAAGLGLYTLLADRDGGVGRGTALVGGPFTMINHRGEVVTEKDFLGNPLLLFFGFTYCPDICPTELQVMAAALDMLGTAGQDIQPVFVSVDPARDTAEVMAQYVGNFGDRFAGLTGSPEQVAAMAREYRVFYEKRENTSDPAAYLMDHSSIIYLMGPDGKFLKHFSYTTDAKTLADGLRLALNR